MSNKEYSLEEYEQALENVRAEWGTSDRDIDILQELVDRATPEKPILLHSGYDDGSEICDTWDCPNCGETFVIEDDTGKCNYCPNCGQKLLWEDKQ